MRLEEWSQEKRLIVFLVATFLFLIAYVQIVRRWAPPPPKLPETTETGTAPEPVQPHADVPPAPEQPHRPVETPPESWPTTPIRAERERTVVVRTRTVETVWTNRGAVALHWRLLHYPDLQGDPLEMIPQYLSSWRPLRIVDAQGRPISALDQAVYRVRRRRHRDGSIQLTFTYADADVWITKTLQFPEDRYDIDGSVQVRWKTSRKSPVYLVWAPGLEHSTPKERKAAGWSFHPVRGVYWSEKVHAVGGDASLHRPLGGQSVRWLGLHSNFFLAAFLGEDGTPITEGFFSKRILVQDNAEGDTDALPEEFRANQDILMATAVAIPADRPLRFRLYVGPKDLDILAQVDPTLPDAVQYGWFGFIARGLLVLLKFCYRHLVPNYGVAIILVTLLIRLLLWPLSHKMYINSERMKQIQPKIKAIQEKYKGLSLRDPRRQKMNEEMMRLYKEYGVNPMSGCLPMLLQLPILFAFYRLLAVAIELRQAPFVLWIDDLSRPDPYLVTPILMGVVMILQQKLSPTSPDPSQQRIGYIMAAVFTFMFANAQSGLVLYWLFSNLFSIAQQQIYHRVLLRRAERARVAARVRRRRRLKAAHQ